MHLYLAKKMISICRLSDLTLVINFMLKFSADTHCKAIPKWWYGLLQYNEMSIKYNKIYLPVLSIYSKYLYRQQIILDCISSWARFEC